MKVTEVVVTSDTKGGIRWFSFEQCCTAMLYRVVPNTDVAGVIKLSTFHFVSSYGIDPTSVGSFLPSEYRSA